MELLLIPGRRAARFQHHMTSLSRRCRCPRLINLSPVITASVRAEVLERRAVTVKGFQLAAMLRMKPVATFHKGGDIAARRNLPLTCERHDAAELSTGGSRNKPDSCGNGSNGSSAVRLEGEKADSLPRAAEKCAGGKW